MVGAAADEERLRRSIGPLRVVSCNRVSASHFGSSSAKNEKEQSDNEDMNHDGDDGYQSQKESDGYMSDGVWSENDGKELSYMNCTDWKGFRKLLGACKET